MVKDDTAELFEGLCTHDACATVVCIQTQIQDEMSAYTSLDSRCTFVLSRPGTDEIWRMVIIKRARAIRAASNTAFQGIINH